MNKNGFTLIEVLIISIVLFIIGQIGYKNYLKGEKESRDMTRRADIEDIQRRLDRYYQDYWEFPKELTFGLKILDPDGTPYVYKAANGIAEGLPRDPVNKDPYIYTYSTIDIDHLSYKLCAKKQEISGKPYCFIEDKREQFKKDTQKLNLENNK